MEWEVVGELDGFRVGDRVAAPWKGRRIMGEVVRLVLFAPLDSGTVLVKFDDPPRDRLSSANEFHYVPEVLQHESIIDKIARLG